MCAQAQACGEVCVFRRNVQDVELRAPVFLNTDHKNLCRAVKCEARHFQYQLKLLFLLIKTWEVVWSVPGATAGCPREALGDLG